MSQFVLDRGAFVKHMNRFAKGHRSVKPESGALIWAFFSGVSHIAPAVNAIVNPAVSDGGMHGNGATVFYGMFHEETMPGKFELKVVAQNSDQAIIRPVFGRGGSFNGVRLWFVEN